jgi:hypothetical protein
MKKLYIFEVYTVKPDKLDETTALAKKLVNTMKKYPEKFREVKSFSTYQQYIGVVGGFYDVWEVESFADFEKIMEKFAADKELKAIADGYYSLIVPGTFHLEICVDVDHYRQK